MMDPFSNDHHTVVPGDIHSSLVEATLDRTAGTRLHTPIHLTVVGGANNRFRQLSDILLRHLGSVPQDGGSLTTPQLSLSPLGYTPTSDWPELT